MAKKLSIFVLAYDLQVLRVHVLVFDKSNVSETGHTNSCI